MLDDEIVHIKDDGTLCLDSGLTADAFGKIRTAKEHGFVLQLADGEHRIEPWSFEATEVAESGGESHVCYTAPLRGFASPRTLTSILAEGAEDAGARSRALLSASAACGAINALLGEAPSGAGTVGAGGIVLSADGKSVCFLPPETFEMAARNHGEAVYAAVQGAFVNKNLDGPSAFAFTRAAIAYSALSGGNAYTAGETLVRQTDMFDGNFVPLELAAAGVDVAVAQAVDAGLRIPPRMRITPGERRALAKQDAQNEAARAAALSCFTDADVAGALEAYWRGNAPVPSDDAALKAQRLLWQKQQRRRIALRRFLRRNRTALIAASCAAVLAAWAGTGYARGNANLATSRGLTSRQTVEALYTGVHQGDVTVIRDIGKGLKNMMTVVGGFYVTNKQRFAMDQANGTASPAEWLFFKNTSNFWQYGLTQFTVDGSEADCSFDYPRRRDKPTPLAGEDGIPLRKGAVARHTARYNLVHTDSSDQLFVESVTDEVTLTWNGTRWRVTDVSGDSTEQPVKLKTFRADYAAALEASDGDVGDAVARLRAQYPWLPTDAELSAGARGMVGQYNNSAAAAYLAQE